MVDGAIESFQQHLWGVSVLLAKVDTSRASSPVQVDGLLHSLGKWMGTSNMVLYVSEKIMMSVYAFFFL